MAGRYTPIEVFPKDGGALMTRTSLDNAGVYNHSLKRNFRRDLDKEARREGHDYFYPNTSKAIAGQPFPSQLTLTSLTRVGTTVTATRSNGHHFENGETIIISGANQPEYNGEFPIVNVSATTFQYFIVGAPVTPATGTLLAAAKEELTLWHLTRRPNGKTAIIAGSARRLYRYFALEEPGYFEGDGTAAEYFYTVPPVPDPNAPYFELNPGEWIVIGWGFATADEGANRWEAVCINGTSIFNNGVDLPQTYREEDRFVVPLYELREQGVAAVGTIAEYNGILMAADISEIFEDKIEELFAFDGTVDGGDILATQSGNQVVTDSDFFGRAIVSITRVGAIATVTLPEHGFESGWRVTIAGANEVAYNGTFLILGYTENTFDYVVGGFPATPATGTMSLTDMVGKTAIFGRTIANITAYTNTRTVTVDGPATTVAAPGFTIKVRVKASQPVGAIFSGSITATVAAGSQIVNASAAIFAVTDIGKTIRFANGIERTITAFTSPVQVTMALPVTTSAITANVFWISDPVAGYMVHSLASVFRAADVGKEIVWDTGQTRKIATVVSPITVIVSIDLTVPLGLIGLQNLATYERYTETQFINRTQYRVIWSMLDEPTRFGAVFPGTITVGSSQLALSYPVRSLEVGQEVIIIGAGVAGGNLTATILSISNLGQVYMLDEVAETTVTDAGVQRQDSLGSIVGFMDLQGDSSGILKMLKLSKVLVIYKDTAIFLATFTGVAAAPFIWTDLEIESGASLYFRFTLIDVNTDTHVYAGRNSFYKFDLTTQRPQLMPLFELASNVFYEQAILENTNEIFAADNSITQEIAFIFPSTSEDKGLLYDYKQNTLSTITALITAAATLKRPVTGISVGATEDWFVMGTANGVALIYGKTDEAQALPNWNSGREIFFRRELNPYSATLIDYDSDQADGMAHFGTSFNEKDLRSIVVLLASQTPVPGSSLRLRLYGARNVDETPTLLVDTTNTAPATTNLFPTWFRQNYFQTRLTVNGNRSFKYVGKIWEISGVNSRSFIRRPQ